MSLRSARTEKIKWCFTRFFLTNPIKTNIHPALYQVQK